MKTNTLIQDKSGQLETMSFPVSTENPIQYQTGDDTVCPYTGFDMHYALEMGVTLGGKIARYYEDYELIMGTGDVYFHGMWEPHGYKYLEKPCSGMLLIIWPELLINLNGDEKTGFNWMLPFEVPPEQRPRASEEQKRQLIEIARKFEAAMQSKTIENKIPWYKCYLMEMLVVIQQGWNPTCLIKQQKGFSYNQISKAIDLVFNTRQFVSEDEAAKVCGMGKTNFCNAFASLMGMSYAKFSLRYRLNGASKQLAQSSEPIKKIADDWGFTDVSHLCNSFEKHYGRSPTEYRKNRVAV